MRQGLNDEVKTLTTTIMHNISCHLPLKDNDYILARNIILHSSCTYNNSPVGPTS